MPRGTALQHQLPAGLSRDINPQDYILDLPTKKAPEPMGTGASLEEARYWPPAQGSC